MQTKYMPYSLVPVGLFGKACLSVRPGEAKYGSGFDWKLSFSMLRVQYSSNSIVVYLPVESTAKHLALTLLLL